MGSKKKSTRKKSVNEMPDTHYRELLLSQLEGIKFAIYASVGVSALYTIFIVMLSVRSGW